MAKKDYPFQDDEFDVAGAGRAPQGVHRTRRPRWRALLPFLVVLLIAPALAYVGVSYLAGQGAADGAGSGVTAAPTDSPEDVTPTPEATEAASVADEEPVAEPTPEPTPEPTREPGIPRDVRVAVLNGTTASGLAASAAAKLQEDGFTATTLGNASSRVPTRSTVYYNNAALAESAQQVATVLGIGPIMELASATTSIAVVLRNDYVG